MIKGVYVRDGKSYPIGNPIGSKSHDLPDTNGNLAKAKVLDINDARAKVERVDGREWCYIDMEKLESEIRADERKRIAIERRRLKKKREQERQQAIKNFLYIVRQKLCGVLVLVATYWMLTSDLFYDTTIGGNDGTFCVITIPLGLFLLLSNRRLDEWEEEE